jgi:hypothetical protein
MKLSDQKKILKAIFSVGVDGNNANAYYILDKYIDILPIEAKKLTFTLPTLKSVLSELSKEWDERINEVVDQ